MLTSATWRDALCLVRIPKTIAYETPATEFSQSWKPGAGEAAVSGGEHSQQQQGQQSLQRRHGGTRAGDAGRTVSGRRRLRAFIGEQPDLVDDRRHRGAGVGGGAAGNCGGGARGDGGGGGRQLENCGETGFRAGPIAGVRMARTNGDA